MRGGGGCIPQARVSKYEMAKKLCSKHIFLSSISLSLPFFPLPVPFFFTFFSFSPPLFFPPFLPSSPPTTPIRTLKPSPSSRVRKMPKPCLLYLRGGNGESVERRGNSRGGGEENFLERVRIQEEGCGEKGGKEWSRGKWMPQGPV